MTSIFLTINKEKNPKKFLKSFLKAGCILLNFLPLSQASPTQQKTIGILQIIAHPALDKTQKGIVDGIREKHPHLKITVKVAQGNILNATMIAQKFVSEGVEAMVVLGTTAAQVAAKAAQVNKTPVVFASVTDPLGAHLVTDLKKPKGFVTGISNYTAQRPQLLYFKELVPRLKTLGFIYNPGEANSVALLADATKAAQELKVTIIPVAVTKTTEVSLATQKLVAHGIDGIFINNDNTALAAFDVIAQISQRNNIPLFVSDTDMVPQGALAALGPDQYTLGLQCSEMVLKILKGVDVANLPVQFPAKKERYLNKDVAQKIGLQISKEALKKADVIFKVRKGVKGDPKATKMQQERKGAEGCQRTTPYNQKSLA